MRKLEKTVRLARHRAHDDDDIVACLLRRERPRYTYRLLLLPETIGSVAYLSHNEHLIPCMKGGLFLEMFGLCRGPG